MFTPCLEYYEFEKGTTAQQTSAMQDTEKASEQKKAGGDSGPVDTIRETGTPISTVRTEPEEARNSL
jgi:hypothetical protein